MTTVPIHLRDGRAAKAPFATKAEEGEPSAAVKAIVAVCSVMLSFAFGYLVWHLISFEAVPQAAASTPQRAQTSALAAACLVFPFFLTAALHGAKIFSSRSRANGSDPLTGLLSQSSFRKVAQAVLMDCEGRDSAEPVALFVIAVDEPDVIRAVFGPDGTPAILCAIGEAIGGSVRSSDPVSHFGDGTYAALLTGVGAETAAYIADRMRRSVSGIEVRPNGHRFDLTVSIGVTVMNGRLGYDTVYSDAARRLVEARDNGQNCAMTGRFGKETEIWPDRLPVRLSVVQPDMQRRGPGRVAEREAEMRYWRAEDARHAAPDGKSAAAE